MADQQLHIKLHDSLNVVLPSSPLPVGVHTFKLNTFTNAVLSTFYVKSATGTVTADYYDLGGGAEVGSLYTLFQHNPLSAGEQERRAFSKVHNQVRLDITVTGGPAEVGVLITAINSSLDIRDYIDGQTANTSIDGGIPIVTYNDDDNKFYLLRSNNGILYVDGYPGVFKPQIFKTAIATGPEFDLIDAIVPVGKSWNIYYGSISFRHNATWSLFVDAEKLAVGITGPARPHDRENLPGPYTATEGQHVILKVIYSTGPGAADITGTIGLREI